MLFHSATVYADGLFFQTINVTSLRKLQNCIEIHQVSPKSQVHSELETKTQAWYTSLGT